MSLVQDLGYDNMNEAGNIIIEGRELLEKKGNQYTRQLLHQLRSPTNKIPRKTITIPYEDYSEEVIRLREGTSTKTYIMDPKLAEIGLRRFNVTCWKVYSSSRYRKVPDLLIHKDQNNFWHHHLCPILLFGIGKNLHNERLGKKAMHIEKFIDTLAPKHYSSIKRKAADAQYLNTRLFYGITRLKRVSSTFFF